MKKMNKKKKKEVIKYERKREECEKMKRMI